MEVREQRAIENPLLYRVKKVARPLDFTTFSGTSSASRISIIFLTPFYTRLISEILRDGETGNW